MSGCTYGKMPNCAFSPNLICAKKAFELIHLDLKSFPTDLYQKYKYLIIFTDDYAGFAWILCMWIKSESIKHTCDFIALVSIYPTTNGCTERFMCTMMDKAEAMHHEACTLPSYWEFAT